MKQNGVRSGREATSRQRMVSLLLTSALLLPIVSSNAWATDQRDPAALLAEGTALLQRNEAQAALLMLERASFLDPENPAILAAYARALAALGAFELARQLMPTELRENLAPQQVLELSLGYSNNRRQEPSLAGLTLTLPGIPPTYFLLDEPLEASPGVLLGFSYRRTLPFGSLLNLRLTTAPDQRLGSLDLQTLTPLDATAAWKLKFDYQKNLASGAQAGLFLGRSMHLAAPWGAELEAGLRQENGSIDRQLFEWRAGVNVAYGNDQWLLARQRAYPLSGGEQTSGGQQRWLIGWLHNRATGPGTLHTALLVRSQRDSEAYHPLLANGAVRRQHSAHAQLRYELPQTRLKGWFLQLGYEKHHSNLELFRYTRTEISLGWQEGW